MMQLRRRRPDHDQSQRLGTQYGLQRVANLHSNPSASTSDLISEPINRSMGRNSASLCSHESGNNCRRSKELPIGHTNLLLWPALVYALRWVPEGQIYIGNLPAAVHDSSSNLSQACSKLSTFLVNRPGLWRTILSSRLRRSSNIPQASTIISIPALGSRATPTPTPLEDSHPKPEV